MTAANARHPLDDYLGHLRPYFDKIEITRHRVHQTAHESPEIILTLRNGKRRLITFTLIKLPSHVSEAQAAATVSHVRWLHAQTTAPRPFLVLAPYISAAMGRYFRENGLQYLDRLGNCFLELGADQPTCVADRKPSREPTGTRELRAAGLQLVLALLIQPDLVNAPVRMVADTAGVGKSTVATTFRELEHRGFLGRSASKRHLLDIERLREEWFAAYARTLRRHLLIGRYQTAHGDPAELERAVEAALKRSTRGRVISWGWGGGAGAFRLTPYHHGAETILHVHRVRMRQPRSGTVELGQPDQPIEQLLAAIRAQPSKNGNLVILEGLGLMSFQGLKPHTVHPLLILAELLATSDPRAHDAAREIRQRFVDAGHES